jgi:Na+/melibiose symporter-like transporter
MGGISERRSCGAGVGTAAYFLLTGIIFATWASRVPAIKGGLDLSDGQFAIALLGLEAGAVLGLQLGGLLVPRVGSRRALATSLVVFTCALLGPAFAPSLLLMAASLGAAPPQHFFACAVAAVVAGLAAWPLLLTWRFDAAEERSEDGSGGLRRWFGDWSRSIALLGALAFCFTLAEGAGLNWSTVYFTESLGGTEALGAVALGVFLGVVTLGRLAGDRLVSCFGAVRVFRAGAIVAGAGFGGALLVDAPAAGLVGLGLLGIANALPLVIGAGGNAPGETPAAAAARVSTLGYLGSFVGPALVGGLASLSSLPLALGLPALLVLATAFGARAVRRAG